MPSTNPDHPARFSSGEDQAAAQVDFGSRSGYFVRLDVELECLDDTILRPGNWGWLVLSVDDARRLANQLIDRASQVEALRDGVGA